MKGRRLWAIGGFISGAVLIMFGVVALYMGINAYQTGRSPAPRSAGSSRLRIIVSHLLARAWQGSSAISAKWLETGLA